MGGVVGLWGTQGVRIEGLASEVGEHEGKVENTEELGPMGKEHHVRSGNLVPFGGLFEDLGAGGNRGTTRHAL